jgi:hypothetical protein
VAFYTREQKDFPKLASISGRPLRPLLPVSTGLVKIFAREYISLLHQVAKYQLKRRMIEIAACLTQYLLGHSLHLLKILFGKAVQSCLSADIEAF